MNRERLLKAGRRRRRTKADEAKARREALDVVLEETAGDEGEVAEAARLAGVSRATVYNELARRRRNGSTPNENTNEKGPTP